MRHKVVLISPYDLGRQPFGLAHAAACLKPAGFEVVCVDLAQQRLQEAELQDAVLVGIHLAMHTATRIATEALPRIRQLAPQARFCVFGLYAPTNAAYFRELGIEVALGGECEPDLVSVAQKCRDGRTDIRPLQTIRLDKIHYQIPDRSNLPELDRYAKLIVPGDEPRMTGFAESSRGCKHLCRHCPIVPIYAGKFRVIPVATVMADIRQQVAAGARHISFGDPDFLNGPTHAKRLVQAFKAEFPKVTFDATIKVEHLLQHRDLLPELAAAGCLFVTSAIESVEDETLERLIKNHRDQDFDLAAGLLRAAGIDLAPTFVAFTPWTTMEGYLRLLRRLVSLKLVENVPPIQLAIRLLVPAGSRLLDMADFRRQLGKFDTDSFGYPWSHTDPKMDELQAEIFQVVESGEGDGLPRTQVFHTIWQAAHTTADLETPPLPNDLGKPIPHHSEPWYCCAEPTQQQLQSF